MNKEKIRLQEFENKAIPWKLFGPYMSERQWGTVREDYSEHGNAWEFLPHDWARSKAYRWGEDGIGGFSDDQQLLNISLALWNGKDPILKERFFGLTGNEGNHGEDCKELYFYLDATPSHSYNKMLYKYPIQEFPYQQLVHENKRRSKHDAEFEIIDTGIFEDGSYYDVIIEYAKASPEDILIKYTIFNRSLLEHELHILPQLFFRNTWSWYNHATRPILKKQDDKTIQIDHPVLGKYNFYADSPGAILFCENESNTQRLYNIPNKGLVKDGINDFIIHQQVEAINRTEGTKSAIHYKVNIPSKKSIELKFRLTRDKHKSPFKDFDGILDLRKTEADEFYLDIQKDVKSKDEVNIQRQAFAGMLWSKQYYYFDVDVWLKGDATQVKPPENRKKGRNKDWEHLNNADIISMPDKWEYPWYAAWDLAFHTIPLAMVDPDFSKKQLLLLTKEWYMHPNGQLPAYEWAFGDVNPPVHAWASWRVYKIDQKANGGKSDVKFLEEVYHKLLLNFTWWVNKKDYNGNNIFQGGFLGMDNIGVFDRSSALPTGGFIEQSDGTSWMAMFTLNMMRISLELSKFNPVYQSLATKFFEHFLYIAGAMANVNNEGLNLWDDEDEFFYDVLHTSEGQRIKMKLRSMVGLIPIFAVEVLDDEIFNQFPEFTTRLNWFLDNRPELANLISRWPKAGSGNRHLLSLLRGHRLKCLLKRMLNQNEFLSDYGIRALSKVYQNNPYQFFVNGNLFEVKYTPAESDTHLFGGNSNWRGPIWFPVNYLLIESLQKFYHYYGDDFKVEMPTGSGKFFTLKEIAEELANRLTSIFRKNDNQERPVSAVHEIFQEKEFAEYVLFYEYFHGDSGRGVGASHQTGWTGLVAKLIQIINSPKN